MHRDDPIFKKMYPFESKYIELSSGHRMHYLDEGSENKEIMVMLHGNPSWSFYYRRLIQAYRDTYRVIVPDHLGMGFSDKPQDYAYTLERHLKNLTELLSLITEAAARISLVVHDWGGAIGMGWATTHADQVNKLIILNTGAFLSNRIPFRINICRLPVFGAIAIRGFNAFAALATSMAVCKSLTPEVKAGFLLPYDNWANRIATLRFVQDIPLQEGERSFSTLEKIDHELKILRDKPMLILWGGKDWCFNDYFYSEWRDRFPEAEAEYYSDGGHYILEDKHESIIPRIRDFMKN